MPRLLQQSNLRARAALAGVALLVEYLIITLRFDASTVATRGGPWAFAGKLGAVAPLGVAMAAAFVLLRREALAFAEPPPPPNYRWFGAHLVALPIFAALTLALFGDGEAPRGSALAWILAWGFFGAISAVTLFAGCIGWRLLGRLLRSRAALLAATLGLIAWAAGRFSSALWAPLSRATFALVLALLSPLGAAVSADPATRTLALGSFVVDIAPECSGFEGIGLAAILFGGYLIAFRSSLRFPRALLLLPLSMFLVWLGNALRIALLLLLGAYVNPELAYGAFHSKAGWVLFCGISLGLAASSKRLGFFRREGESETRLEPNFTLAYLAPLLAITAVGLLSGMLFERVDLLYGLRPLAAAAALYAFRRRLPALVTRAPVLGAALGLVLAVAWLASAPKDASAARAVHDAFAARPAWFFWGWCALRATGAVVFVPIAEELAFRGMLLRWLVARDFSNVSLRAWTPLSLIGSSLAFGALHERWLAASLAGACYACAQIRSGRVADAIAAHAVTNAVLAAWVILTGDFSQWL